MLIAGQLQSKKSPDAGDVTLLTSCSVSGTPLPLVSKNSTTCPRQQLDLEIRGAVAVDVALDHPVGAAKLRRRA